MPLDAGSEKGYGYRMKHTLAASTPRKPERHRPREARPPKRNRGGRPARLVAWLLVVGLSALYAATRHPSATVGDLTATRADAQHLLWHAAARAVLALPVSTPEIRLSWLSAIGGGLAGGLLFAAVRCLLLLFCRGTHITARVRKRAALLAGLAAAAAFAFSQPVWLAATRPRPELFDLALCLAAVWLLVLATASGNLRALGGFAFLYGLLLFEFSDALRLAPVFVVFTAVLLTRMERRDMQTAAWLVGFAAVGVLAYLWGVTLAARDGAIVFRGDMALLNPALAAIRMHLRTAVTRWVLNPGTLPVLMVSIAPWLAGLALGAWTLGRDPYPADNVLHALLAGAVVLALVNTPISPWVVQRALHQLPCATQALSAALAGYLVGWGVIVSGGSLWHAPAQTDDEWEAPPGGALGRFMAWALMLLIVAAAVLNARFRVRGGWLPARPPAAVVSLASVATDLPGRPGR